MKIDLEQLIWALSSTVDLVGVDEVQHGKRVAYMALRCAEHMGLPATEVTQLYRIGLLHDCGVSSSVVHKNLVNDLEWEGADVHCETGAERISQFFALKPLSNPIRYHHTRWESFVNIELPYQDKLYANLIFLLDRVDALIAGFAQNSRLATREYIYDRLKELKDTFFFGELVDLFLEASKSEEFWIVMETQHLESFLADKRKEVFEDIVLNPDDLLTIAKVFAQIVDAKSSYTAEHSYGVANLAKYLAKQTGFDENDCQQLEVAGLLHDLGKLQVSDQVLEMKGALDDESLSMMRHHSFVTYQILRQIDGFEQISTWASDHHEKLDGSGYPFKKIADELPLPSRIIAVADICQALAQDRPYRASQSVGSIISLLKKQVAMGLLDKKVVELVLEESELCYKLAKYPSGKYN